MKIGNDLRFVLNGLLARKGRSALTILGMVIGVAGVVVIMSLGAGAQSLVLSQINKLGSNLIGVLPGKSNENGPPAAVFGVQVNTLTIDDAEAMGDRSRVPHVTSVSAVVRGSATVVWRDQNIDTNFTATQASYPVVQNAPLLLGRFFDEREERGGAQVIVLGYDIKQQLFGQTDPIGEVVKIKNIPFEVIGVTEKQGTVAFQNQDDQVFIPLVIGQRQILGIRHVQFIRAKVDDASNVKASMAEIQTLLRERHRIQAGQEDDFSVRDLADAIKILTGITDALRLFLVAMAAISLVVGGIGIMNIMLVTVAERTREIGLRKAVGARPSAVRNQFLLESLITTSLGGLIGIICGVTISYLIALAARAFGYDWDFVISILSLSLAVGVSALVGIIFGLYPAIKAARLDPIEALRYE
mgnify:CR=1 FL=1